MYGKLKLEFGWCFGFKGKDWKVTEVTLDDGDIALVKDYKPATEETPTLSGKKVKVELDGKTYTATLD